MKKVSIILLSSFILFTSCKKNKEEEVVVVPVKTTAQRVLGRWGITSVVLNDFYNNLPHISSFNGTSTDYIEFKTNGKVLLNFVALGPLDSTTYNVVNDTTLNIDGELNKIKELTDTKFVLYTKNVSSTSPLEYEEQTINLKK